MVMIGWNEKAFRLSNYWNTNLDAYVKGVMERKTSAVFLFDGRSGLGKTTLSFQTGCAVAKKINEYMIKKDKNRKPKFDLNDVTWTPQDFIEKLRTANKGDIIILDESMILSNRSSMSEYNKAVIIMMSLIRSKQIFVFFNVNSIFDLDRNLVLHRADVLLHLYAPDDRFGARGNYFVVPIAKGKLKNLYINGKKFYNYSCARPAFRDNFSKFFPFDEKEYESKKQKAIESYFSNKDGKKSPLAQKMRDNVFKYLINEKKMPQKELATIAQCSERTISRVINNKDVDIKEIINEMT